MSERPPSGSDAPVAGNVARRRRRISDVETESRMLDAAIAMIHRSGLTVSLEHLSLEDVIRDAGVSRSAVYRRWPYKDLFFSDLLRELAKAAVPADVPTVAESYGGAIELLGQHLDWVGTPDGRRALLLEIVRTSQDFETVRRSVAWRTYLALHATFLSLEDGELRDDVRAALAESERRFIDRIARSHRELGGLLGFRMRPGFDADYEMMARIGTAMLRGIVLMAPAMPELAEQRLTVDPFDVGRLTGPVEWTSAGLALASFTMTILEPDPHVEWDGRRVEWVRQELAGRSAGWPEDRNG